jgi:FkbM family methyltransferase
MSLFRSIRESLKMLGRFFTVRIKSGPLKGKRWIAASGSHFIAGDYEAFKTEAVLKSVAVGDVCYDVGGHVGYYTVTMATLAGPQGRVFTFEPRPLNAAYIRRHLEINGVTNVTLTQAAVSDHAGKAGFEARTGTGTGRLSESGNLQVQCVVLDDWVKAHGIPPPSFVKIDVEGGEIGVLNGARRTIEAARPKLLVATHGKKENDFVCALLDEWDYEYEVLNPDAVRGDTEIRAVPRGARR